jgi:hypothetical protein
MNRLTEDLYSVLRQRGVCSARELQTAIGASAPTLSRLLTSPEAGEVVRMGRARSTCYALQRDVRGLGASWPLYTIEADSEARLVGQLHALTGGQWLLQQAVAWGSLVGDEFALGIFPGLPWFLQDLRPRGFLGRLIARSCADEQGLPADPRDWSDDDTVQYLLTRGDELPGSFVLGRRALAEAQASGTSGSNMIGEADRATAYPALAEGTLAGEVPGSSAAGEQPKFTARVCGADESIRDVIVKFSGAGGRPEDERWRDLLIAEHVANRVLTEAGIPCAATTLLEAGGRCFLESVRFDRVGPRGRYGFASLEAFDSAFFGQLNTTWDEAAARYRDTGWLSGSDAERLSLLWWFGTLIGNTDMHYGNAGALVGQARPFGLAPTYDMVPMLYRPDIEGRLPDRPLTVTPPPPESRDCWLRALSLARVYWARMAGMATLSDSFRQLSEANSRTVGDVHACV